MDIFIQIRKTVTNVHKHWNPKNTKHLRLSFLIQVQNFFITFLSLRFFDIRGKRSNFFLCWLFHLTPPHAAPRCKLLVWPRRVPENHLPSSRVESLFFFSNSKILSPWRHSRPRSHILSGVFIMTSVIVISALHAREHLHSMCAPNYSMH